MQYFSSDPLTPAQLNTLRSLLSTNELMAPDKNGVVLDESLPDLSKAEASKMITTLAKRAKTKHLVQGVHVGTSNEPATQKQWAYINNLYGLKRVTSKSAQKDALRSACNLESFQGLTSPQASSFIKYLLTL